MKKIFAGIIAATMALSVCAVSVSAAGRGKGCGNVGGKRTCCVCENYTDKDGNGICDVCEKVIRSRRNCTDFIDNDNDGICDNYANRTRPMDGSGRGSGCRGGRNN